MAAPSIEALQIFSAFWWSEASRAELCDAFSCSGVSIDAHFRGCVGSGKHAKVCPFF
jgi:hypothetical protein